MEHKLQASKVDIFIFSNMSNSHQFNKTPQFVGGHDLQPGYRLQLSLATDAAFCQICFELFSIAFPYR